MAPIQEIEQLGSPLQEQSMLQVTTEATEPGNSPPGLVAGKHAVLLEPCLCLES